MAIDKAVIRDFWINRARSDQFLWLDMAKRNAELISTHVEPHSRLLSVGCGDMSVERLLPDTMTIHGVDTVMPKTLRTGGGLRFWCGPVTEFRSAAPYDAAIMFGVANFMDDEEYTAALRSIKSMLASGGRLLVKHQSITEGSSDKIVDTEIDGQRYQACYRTTASDMQIISRVFDTALCFKAYPDLPPRHPDSDFILYVAFKNEHTH